jgi:hypothetical protein
VFVFPYRIPARYFLGTPFPHQPLHANYGLLTTKPNGRGAASFAHPRGLVSGSLIAARPRPARDGSHRPTARYP